MDDLPPDLAAAIASNAQLENSRREATEREALERRRLHDLILTATRTYVAVLAAGNRKDQRVTVDGRIAWFILPGAPDYLGSIGSSSRGYDPDSYYRNTAILALGDSGEYVRAVDSTSRPAVFGSDSQSTPYPSASAYKLIEPIRPNLIVPDILITYLLMGAGIDGSGSLGGRQEIGTYGKGHIWIPGLEARANQYVGVLTSRLNHLNLDWSSFGSALPHSGASDSTGANEFAVEDQSQGGAPGA